jgi:hypothetical protein
MMKSAIIGVGAPIAAWVLFVGACGGSNQASGGNDAGSVPDSTSNTVESGVDDDSSMDDAPISTIDASKPPRLKAIGSPCSADADCTSGTCDTTFPNGMCTKTCATDPDCSEKGNKTGAACLGTTCYEFCKDVDGGTVDDAGKVEGPCKNKAFQCVTVPKETAPVCMPNPDAGLTDASAGGG